MQNSQSLEILISTQRLDLARLNSRHAGGPYLSWMNDREITQYLESRFRAHTEADLADYIAKTNKDTANLMLGMFVSSDGRQIGNIKLGPINTYHRRAELCILIDEKAVWGQGFGRKDIACLSDYAFRDLGLHKVTA